VYGRSVHSLVGRMVRNLYPHDASALLQRSAIYIP
jgi:hypothetical protein